MNIENILVALVFMFFGGLMVLMVGVCVPNIETTTTPIIPDTTITIINGVADTTYTYKFE